MKANNRFLDKLSTKETIICGEGYLFEIERRGYLSLGQFIPIVVLNDPAALKELHREFIHCGSDVILAFTYYAHKERLAKIGKEELVEEINRKAIKIAREVMNEPGNENILLAGNICNTNIYDPKDALSKLKCLEMFRDQCLWAKEEGVDFILAETLSYLGEALLALQAIQEVNLPSVINLTFNEKNIFESAEGISIEECYQALKLNGADVVGSNCHLGPKDMLKIGERIRKAVEGPISLLPVTYRTEGCGFFHLKNEDQTKKSTEFAFPDSLEYYLSTRGEIKEFGEKAKELGVQFLGLCCGASPYHLRSLCNGANVKCRADLYNIDMSKHYRFGEQGIEVNKVKYYKDESEKEKK